MQCMLLSLFSLLLVGCLGEGPIYLGGAGPGWHCPAHFEQRAAALLARDGLSATSTFFPTGEAQEQELRYPGRVCAEEAMVLAVDALVASAAPESLSDVSKTLGLPECEARCYFNRRTSLFGLVADSESHMSSRLLPLPPSGARVSQSWVFFLSVPDLGEHGYWAIVSRDGSGVVTLAQN